LGFFFDDIMEWGMLRGLFDGNIGRSNKMILWLKVVLDSRL